MRVKSTVLATSLIIGTSFALASSPIDNKMKMKIHSTDRIVGGVDVPDEERPWVTSIQYDNDHFCGGALIASHWVLTAAHCVEDINGSNLARLTVRAGMTDMSADKGKKAKVKSVHIHQKYGQQNGNAADLALLELSSNINGIQFLKLATQQIMSVAGQPGDMASVSGWGAQEEGGGVADKLQKVDVPIVSNDSCNKPEAYDGTITPTELCAGYEQGGKDSCQGDSGGPLVVKNGGDYYQAGIVSWGEGCAWANKYGVYTRVAAFNQWIQNTMQGDDSIAPPNERPPAEEGFIASGKLVSGLSAKKNQVLDYRIRVKKGARILWLDIRGGRGDADLLASHGKKPDATDDSYAPYLDGNDEHILIQDPKPGVWYIQVEGYEDFDGVELMGFTR